MKTKILYAILLTISYTVFSQSEIDIVGMKYTTTTKSDYYDNIYTSKSNKIDAFINYGHDLGKKNKMFYHVSYHNFNLETDVNDNNNILPAEIPDYSLVNLAIGMTNNLNNNWSLNNILSLTFSNSTDLKSHNYFRSFSYLKKKKFENFNYGFGVYLSNLNNDLSIIPILSLQLKNKKRGLKLFLPRELKFWQSINAKTYLQLQTILNSNYLKFNNNNLNMELLSIHTELTYNYIYNKKLKLKTGIGLPYTKYQYISNSKNYNTDLLSLSFTVGLSYIVYKNVKK